MREPIRFQFSIGSLFSGGCDGLSLGLEWAGHGPVIWQVENDPIRRANLKKIWPGAIRFSDVRNVRRHVLPAVDLICGGFPCTDVSCAGKSAGLGGARSGLWWEMARAIEELQPGWVVVENVGHGRKRWLGPVCEELERQGFETLPIPLHAADVGAPHRRSRIFVVGRHAANAERLQLRKQPRRRGGPRGSGQAESRDDGADGGNYAAASDAEGERCRAPRLPGRAAAAKPDARDGRQAEQSWWEAGPPVCGVAHGVRTKMDRARIAMLGDAVVPQCSQVIGELITLLEVRAIQQRALSGLHMSPVGF